MIYVLRLWAMDCLSDFLIIKVSRLDVINWLVYIFCFMCPTVKVLMPCHHIYTSIRFKMNNEAFLMMYEYRRCSFLAVSVLGCKSTLMITYTRHVTYSTEQSLAFAFIRFHESETFCGILWNRTMEGAVPGIGALWSWVCLNAVPRK
jgi:hypothetical protein